MHDIPPIARPARRRRLLTGAAALLLAAAAPVFAQAYPDRPIRLVVPYPPGGATDVIGRVVGQQLGTVLGQSVVVENKAGAAGNIGAAMVAREKPDGYTLLLGALTSHSINSALVGPAAQFDMVKSFAPVSIVGRVPLVVVVHPGLKANDIAELVALAKGRQQPLSYASSGNGSPQHLAGEMFQRQAGIKLLHVPYKGSSPALTDLMGGQVDLMIDTVPAAQAFIKSGKLRALATATAEPVATLPGVPTAAQAGLKGFEVSSMFGILAPAGTPAAVVERLNAALKDAMAQPAVREGLLAQGAVAAYTTPQEAASAIGREVAQWTQVIKEGGIKAE
jgi:tripartite-type tricarboxylate transporter receptor subunit TctC